MFEVTGQLMLCGINWQDGTKYILSTHPTRIEFPSISWRDNLTELFNRHVDIDINWTKVRLLGCSTLMEESKLSLIFGGLIPLDTPLRDAYWVEFDIKKPDINTMFTENLLSMMRTL